MTITLIDHPLARHLVSHLRDRHTKPALFRTIAGHLTTLLALEATRDLPVKTVTIPTPLEETQGEVLDGELVVVPILRAGLGMLEAILTLFPTVSVGYLGLSRDHKTALASRYYANLPPLAGRPVLLVDPMLATGGSACQALDDLKEAGADRITLICIVASPEGVGAVNAAHPDVRVISAALDRELDSRKYILPGLGDFGDRLYGTMG